jgi:hypothetical protein
LDLRGKVVQVSSSCTLISLAATVDFYRNQETFMEDWCNDVHWQDIYQTGARWHESYMKGLVSELPASMLKLLGAELGHVTPDEVHGRSTAFSTMADGIGMPLSALFTERNLICISDTCEECFDFGFIGEHICSCGGRRPQAVAKSMTTCLQLLSRHVQRMQPEPSPFTMIAGSRTFSIFVKPPKFVVIDSHNRSWTGRPLDTSLVIKGEWVDGADFARSIMPAIGQGDVGYNKPDETQHARVFSWAQRKARHEI